MVRHITLPLTKELAETLSSEAEGGKLEKLEAFLKKM